ETGDRRGDTGTPQAIAFSRWKGSGGQIMQRFRFGLVVSQRDPWPELVERAQLAESLGADIIWVVDHFIGPDDDLQMTFEGWTVLAGLAMATSRVRLGMLVSGNTYRNPGLLAKQAVTVDHISNGRVDFGIGAGWWEKEHEMYGYDFPSAGERVSRLQEALEMIDSLQRNERTTFEGEYYGLQDATFEPKPLQHPSMPIVLGADGPRMLRITARYASIWNTRSEPADAARKSQFLDDACREIERDPGEITRSIWPFPDFLTSVDDFRAMVDAYREIGFTDFVSRWPVDDDQMAVLHEVASEVLPAYRAG
ncbi:MAG: TIGR03560 family F420-dependent LLM class oxidoreductase, partial [Chloroflexota bacterium]